MNNSVWTNAT